MNMLSSVKCLTGLLSAVLLLSSSASGFYFKSQDEIYLSGDFEEDVILAGSTVNFDGSVVGDLFMGARIGTFNGNILGNLHTAGQRATINGTVERSYRGFAQNIIVNADVGGDATLFCQDLTLSNESRIGRDAAFFCAAAFLNGAIDRDAYIFAGEVNISGRIEGNVKINADRITIAPTAHIGGNLEYSSEEKAKISSEAQIMGETKWKKETSATGAADISSMAPPPTGPVWSLIFLAGSIIIGIVIVVSKRAGVTAVVEEIKSNALVSGALGLAIIIVAPILLLLFGFTVIGLPLAIVGMAAYSILFWTGKVFVGIALGVWILSLRKKEGSPSLGWALLLGMIVLALLFKIPLLGWVTYLVAWALGAGALALIFFRRYRNGRKTSPSASAEAGPAQATT
jgi:cytoskeletal protein CcmA (bactofilin family)